jgi:hypothetical protein
MSVAAATKWRRVSLFLGLLFALFGTAEGQSIYYVGPLGTNSPAYGYSPSSPWRTITYAISQASVGGIINVDSGIYHESITINKSLTIQSVDSTTVISPPSGNGITITVSNVILQNLQVRRAPKIGIVASNVSNLTLSNVYCMRDSDSGVQLSKLSGVTVTGGSYSYNGRHGFNTTKGNNYTMSNVRADSNGYGIQADLNYMNGSGINLVGIRGTSTASNLTTRYNRMYGLVIGDSSTGITVNGGTFRKNGKDWGYNGGGIFIYSEAQSDSNIAIQGTIVADSNATAGIWLSAQNTSCVIKNIQIGQSGTTTLVNNGGAGIILLGNVISVTATGNFTKGTGTNAGGIIVAGKNSLTNPAPLNILIKNCTFNAGYDSTHPAITMDDGFGDKSGLPIAADGNTFAGAGTLTAVEYVIHDSLDNPALGRVNHTNDKPLPVELVSFDAQVIGSDVTLVWSTATEVNSYGFEIQRGLIGELTLVSNRQSAVLNSQSMTGNPLSAAVPWQSIGFVPAAGSSFSPRSYSFTDASVVDGEYVYRLKKMDKDETFSFSNQVNVVVGSPVTAPTLGQNFPNPFNPQTSIEFAVPVTGKTVVRVFNILGQRIAVLFDGLATGGTRYRLQFDATGIPSGLYFYQLEFGLTRLTRRMLLLK